MLIMAAIGISVCLLMLTPLVFCGINLVPLAFMILIVASILLLMGIVDVAAMEDEDSMTRRQRLSRRLSIAAVSAFSIPFILVPAGMSGSLLAFLVLLFLLLGSLVACYLSVAICLTRLAKRGSKTTLARNTACTFWVLGLSVLLAFTGTTVIDSIIQTPPQIISTFFVSIGLIFAIAYIAAVVILVQHRRMLTKAIRSREAMDNAAQADQNIDIPGDIHAADPAEPKLSQD